MSSSQAASDSLSCELSTVYRTTTRHGGFGRSPKFFNATCIELLLCQGWAASDAMEMAISTLDAIARWRYGQIGGGFHQR